MVESEDHVDVDAQLNDMQREGIHVGQIVIREATKDAENAGLHHCAGIDNNKHTTLLERSRFVQPAFGMTVAGVIAQPGIRLCEHAPGADSRDRGAKVVVEAYGVSVLRIM